MTNIQNGKRHMFDLTYCTINKYNGIRGKLIQYKRYRLVMKNGNKSEIEQIIVAKKIQYTTCIGFFPK